MKALRLIGTMAGLALSLMVSASAEIVHIDTTDDKNGKSVTVPTGKLMHVHYLQANPWEGAEVKVDDVAVVKFYRRSFASAGSAGGAVQAYPGAQRDLKFNGTTVHFGQHIQATYEFVDPPGDAPNGTDRPSNAVVIPALAGGDVEIILESSSDLINWVRALPGTYGPAFVRRFFRVRAEQQTGG